jgi:hypothetical protein
MAIDRDKAMLDVKGFAGLPPPVPQPPRKPLDVHVARAAEDNLTLNVVNVNYEVREIVVAQGIEFHNSDMDARQAGSGFPQFVGIHTIPASLKHDLPTIVLQSETNAVYISDAQHVEFRIRVVRTKDKFKEALETPGIHVVYCGHARWGRGPCFGPDVGFPVNATGDNWEDGVDSNTFGLYRMGHPFVPLPLSELEEHKYNMNPVPTSVRVDRADVDGSIGDPNSLRPVDLKGSRFEPFIQDKPLADAYWGCKVEGRDGLLLHAGFENSRAAPNDLGATDIKCRCFSVIGCETFDHFHKILRNRKGHKRTDTDGFAFFTTAISDSRCFRVWMSSLLEYPVRNDFQSWKASLDFAVKRSNEKLAAMGASYRII